MIPISVDDRDVLFRTLVDLEEQIIRQHTTVDNIETLPVATTDLAVIVAKINEILITVNSIGVAVSPPKNSLS